MFTIDLNHIRYFAPLPPTPMADEDEGMIKVGD